MKQLLQSLKNGSTNLVDVPSPQNASKSLLIQTRKSLVSSGTERMLVEFGKAGLIQKARQQPDKFRMVIDKIKTDGFQPTIDAVFSKLEQPLPLGYCNVGNVCEVGNGVSDYNHGDRVISNGHHAQVVGVPFNLCAKVPDNVSDDEAAFTVMGSIALQGIRLINPTLGETIAVTGLGLIGLITVQLLRANGCRVLGLDYDSDKLELAKQFGAEVVDLSSEVNPLDFARYYSRGYGIDAVVVTAATKSSEPIHQAALMCRKRGRIVLVGVTGLELSRDDFFKKELSFQVSASYGPGRYDTNYELKGNDYPIGFVRWTEQRNFVAVLDMISSGRLDVKPLISHRFNILEAVKAYDLLSAQTSSLGILIEYPAFEITQASKTIQLKKNDFVKSNEKQVNISFIGSGGYATKILIPSFKATGAHLLTVASQNGVSGVFAGRKFGFENTTTDLNQIFEDKACNALVITTRHNSHAQLVKQALEAGKNVFVEKPLCLSLGELFEIEKTYQHSSFKPVLMVGFNRRFSPHVQKIKKLLHSIKTPKSFIITVNAGQIDEQHWSQDLEIGGGRIIGEACHFVDLLRFLADSSIVSLNSCSMTSKTKDTVTIGLKFEDGSIGSINYFANGPRSFPKERLEVFVDSKTLQLDNFRKLSAFGWGRFKKMNLWKQDKGQKNCCDAFINAVANGESAPIPIEELLEVSRISIEIAQSS